MAAVAVMVVLLMVVIVVLAVAMVMAVVAMVMAATVAMVVAVTLAVVMAAAAVMRLRAASLMGAQQTAARLVPGCSCSRLLVSRQAAAALPALQILQAAPSLLQMRPAVVHTWRQAAAAAPALVRQAAPLPAVRLMGVCQVVVASAALLMLLGLAPLATQLPVLCLAMVCQAVMALGPMPWEL